MVLVLNSSTSAFISLFFGLQVLLFSGPSAKKALCTPAHVARRHLLKKPAMDNIGESHWVLRICCDTIRDPLPPDGELVTTSEIRWYSQRAFTEKSAAGTSQKTLLPLLRKLELVVGCEYPPSKCRVKKSFILPG